MSCIFCDIVEGKTPASFIYEDEDYMAFYDIHPKAATHIVIIPRNHIASLAAATEEEAPLMEGLITLAQYIASELGLTGYQLQMNVGKGGGQEIMHVHLHLLSSESTIDEE